MQIKNGRKGKKEKKTHTQLPGFALFRQLLASRAGILTKQLRKQNTRSVFISEYYVTIT